MRSNKIMLIAGLAVALVQPVMGQTKLEQKGQLANPGVAGMADQALEDAGRLCSLIVDNEAAILDALESEGWDNDVTYDIGNAPFYKEISAFNSYEGVGDAEIWGFLEEYPGYWIGYCSFTVLSPETTIDINAINARADLTGSVQQNESGTFGSWRDNGSSPSTFVHAYQTEDSFVLQITKLTDLAAQ